MSASSAPGFSRRVRTIVFGSWLIAAVCLNAFLMLGHPGAAPRPTVATSGVGRPFPGTGTDAVAYLVGKGPAAPDSSEGGMYDAVVHALRHDAGHVGAVLDWSSDPLTAPMGAGPDGTTTAAVIWLAGQAGTTQAADSLAAVRSLLHAQPFESQLQARIVVPAAAASGFPTLQYWQGFLIVAAAGVAVGWRLSRRLPRWSTTTTLLAAVVAFAVSWPLVVWLDADLHPNVAAAPALPATVSALVILGILATSATSITHSLRDRASDVAPYRRALPAMTVPGLSALVLTAPLLCARTPALQHGVGVAAVAAAVALVAAPTMLYAALGRSGGPSTETTGGATGSVGDRLRPAGSRIAVAVAVVLAVCTQSLVGTRLVVADIAAGAPVAADGSPAFRPFDRLPDVVTIQSPADLRNPAGLVAVDRVSRHLMELPGVRRVQSAAWPEGIPRSDATLAHGAGKLGERLQRQAAALLPQINSIKSLSSAIDQMDSAVGLLHTTVDSGTSSLKNMQHAIDLVVSGTTNMNQTVREVSERLDPIRKWTAGVDNCSGEFVCREVLQVINPIDRVTSSVAVLSDGADEIAAEYGRTTRTVASAPQSVDRMQSALDTLRPLVSTLRTTVEDTIPQVVQLSAYLRNLSADFDGTGEGGFYLSRKDLSEPSYRTVLDETFSPNGTTTRLLVYSDAAVPTLNPESTVGQLKAAAGSATKYGSLARSVISVRGPTAIAASARDALHHDLMLEATLLLIASALIGMRRGTTRALIVGLGVTTSCLIGLGATAALWHHLVGREMVVAVPAVSIALLVLIGFPYLAASNSSRKVSAAAPWAGVMLGLGLSLAGGASPGPLAQLGVSVAVGTAALIGVARVGAPVPVGHARVSRS